MRSCSARGWSNRAISSTRLRVRTRRRVISGEVCRIIIEGNKLQALSRAALILAPSALGLTRSVNEAIGNAEALCELGTGTYDGVEIMSDAQKEQANAIMVDYVGEIGPCVRAQFLSMRDVQTIQKAAETFNTLADALFAEMTSGV